MASSYIRVVCIDGPRKGREYMWPRGTEVFGINSVVPQSVYTAYHESISGYGQYIYSVRAMWGLSWATNTFAAVFDRLAYK